MFIYWLVIDGLVYEWCVKLLGSIDGLGTKRIFGIYIGINQNLSKLSILLSIYPVFKDLLLFN